MKLSKKGFSLNEVPALVMVFVVIAIVMGVGATILGQIQTTQTTGGYASNITSAGLQAVNSLSTWQGTWVVIVAAAVVLGIIGSYLFFKNR